MWVYIIASKRFLHDRRVLLGSGLILFLTYLTILYLYQLFISGYAEAHFVSIILLIGSTGWILLWGGILASTIAQDEFRLGTLEMMMTTPMTIQQLNRAMAIAPT